MDPRMADRLQNFALHDKGVKAKMSCINPSKFLPRVAEEHGVGSPGSEKNNFERASAILGANVGIFFSPNLTLLKIMTSNPRIFDLHTASLSSICLTSIPFPVCL